MERLEELEILINNQESKVEEARDQLKSAAEEAEGAIRKKIIEILSPIVPEENISVSFPIAGWFSYWSGKVELQRNGSTVFGTNIDIYLNHRADGYKFEFNTGTSGAFDKKNLDQILKYRMLAECLNNFEEIEKFVIDKVEATKPYTKKEFDEERVLAKLMNEKADINKKIKQQELLAQINQNTIFKNVYYKSYRRDNGFKNYQYMKVLEFKANTVILVVGYRAYRDGAYQEFIGVDNYRYNKDSFINDVLEQRLVMEQM